MSKFLFLDRDGTLIRHIPYLSDPNLVELLPGVVAGLRLFRAAGWCTVLVSNQSGVGRGFFGVESVLAVHQKLESLLSAEGLQLDLYLFCPHRPEDACQCRKPRPGMANVAFEKLGGQFDEALVVGDSDCDMDLAVALGCAGRRTGESGPTLEQIAKQILTD